MIFQNEVEEEVGCNFDFHEQFHEENDGRVKVLTPYRFQIEQVPHHGSHMNFVFFGKCNSYDKNRNETDEQEKLRWFSKL